MNSKENKNKNWGNLRQEYSQSKLSRSDIDKNPFIQFEKWMQEAIECKISDPNAIILATTNKNLQVSSRTVLLKGIENEAFLFFTNYQSQKGKNLAENPQAAFTLYWRELERQICVQGKVEKISQQKSESYFHSRPKESQISVCVSEKQSEEIKNRQELENKSKEIKTLYEKQEQIPLPHFWGGYRLLPSSIEFWQGRENRLHDRLCYFRKEKDWEIKRLKP